jgi:hypothetical protein
MPDSELLERFKFATSLTPESQHRLTTELIRRGLAGSTPAERFPHLNTAFSRRHPLVLTLGFLRLLSSLQRRTFPAGPPLWLQDATGYLNKLNPLDLLPTIVAISFAPAHFFNRCSPNAARRKGQYTKRRLYKTPLNFLIKGMAVAGFVVLVADHYLAGDVMRHLILSASGRANRETFAGVTLPFVITAPLWMLVVALLSTLMLRIVAASPLAGWFSNFDFNPIRIILSSYKEDLYHSLFLWNLFYFGPYFIVVSVILAVLLVPLYSVMWMFIVALAQADVHLTRSEIQGIFVIFAAILAISVFLTEILLLRPYARVICASVRLPSIFINLWRAEELRDAIAEAADAPLDVRRANSALVIWFGMKRCMDLEDRYVLSLPPKHSPSRLIERAWTFQTIQPELQRWIENLQPLSSHRKWLEAFAEDFGRRLAAEVGSVPPRL